MPREFLLSIIKRKKKEPQAMERGLVWRRGDIMRAEGWRGGGEKNNNGD